MPITRKETYVCDRCEFTLIWEEPTNQPTGWAGVTFTKHGEPKGVFEYDRFILCPECSNRFCVFNERRLPEIPR